MKGNVVIIGVGALGSHVVLFGRNWPNPIRVVDFDKVETKNTLAQFFSKMSLNRNKALGLQQAMQGMWGIKVDANSNKLTSDNVEQLLGGAGLVIDCTDNIAARRVIQAYVRKNGIPCLHGALNEDGTFGRVVWDEHFTPDEETPGKATCEDGRTLPFFALAGAQVAVTAQLFIEKGERRSLMLTPAGIVRLT